MRNSPFSGLPAIQIAVYLGCKVIATASSADKLAICTEKGGAHYGVNYSDKDWQQQVLKITGGKGVDIVYDPVGERSEPSLLASYVTFEADLSLSRPPRAEPEGRWMEVSAHRRRFCGGNY